MKRLGKGSALRSIDEQNGRLDIVLEDRDRNKYQIRLWEGEGVSHLPEPEWLLKGFVQKGGLSVIYGPPASGKSLLMLDQAQHIQMGRQWNGRYVEQGSVLYVMAEGQFGLKGRLEAWKQHFEIPELPGVKYHIEGVSFWTPGDKENRAADSIVMAAAALGTSVVYVDTMAATFGGGDENRQQDMNLWLDPIRELRQHGIAVVVAHHTSKSGETMRGSTVLGGEADVMVEMKPKWDEYNPGSLEYVQVVNQKQKDYIPFVPFRMHLRSLELEPTPGGRERSGPVLIPSDEAYEGMTTRNGRRLEPSSRRAVMRETMVVVVANDPGILWRDIRKQVKGKNEELAVVRDELIEAKILEYDEDDGGYYLGQVELEAKVLAELPDLLGYGEEE